MMTLKDFMMKHNLGRRDVVCISKNWGEHKWIARLKGRDFQHSLFIVDLSESEKSQYHLMPFDLGDDDEWPLSARTIRGIEYDVKFVERRYASADECDDEDE